MGDKVIIKLKKEIKILKKAVRAQDKMIIQYRCGSPCMPEWVFKDLTRCRVYFGENLQDICKEKGE